MTAEGFDMRRQPSDATALRTARTELKRVQGELAQAIRQRDEYRARATKAEQELAQWRERFDLLLRRDVRNGQAT